MLENSVLAPGAASVGVRYTNSQVDIARNDTFVGGQYGAYFTNNATDVTLLDDVFTGQTGACVYFNSDSLIDQSIYAGLVSYFGDGNIYNPTGGGYLATVVDSTQPSNNYSTLDAYAEYWYVKQYGTGILNQRRQRRRHWLPQRPAQPPSRAVFVNRSGGDFRLANVAPNLVDTGVAQVYGRTQQGVSPTVWDAQGNVRVQGNAVDAGAYETAGAISATFTLATAGTTSAGVYDSNGNLIRTLWSGVKYPAGTVTAYWNGLDDNNNPMSNGNYTIKLLSNNVQYVWDGAMNNSSPLWTAPTFKPTSSPSSRW